MSDQDNQTRAQFIETLFAITDDLRGYGSLGVIEAVLDAVNRAGGVVLLPTTERLRHGPYFTPSELKGLVPIGKKGMGGSRDTVRYVSVDYES